jgi:4-alpha-glucanotransferase
MGFSRSSGILLHPSSLPGPSGSGDLGPAAYHFVDWLVSAGQALWQMLPIGGLGAGNSPYVSSSAFAGNPLLIDLHDLQAQGWIAHDGLPGDAGFESQRVDYGLVHAYRMSRLRQASECFFAQAGEVRQAEFAAFCSAESGWLDDYALFMSLAGRFEWRDWADWDPPLAQRDPAALSAVRLDCAGEIRFWQFTQWNFFRQWFALKEYANARGVRIIGDVPIFIALQSAEVWARQSLFELDHAGRPTVVAGVPPDYFSDTGQRWGNPLYRWSAHEAEGYAWWIERLRHATRFADMVRIDHFRGFAAYWEIAASEPTAIHGCWRPGPGARLFEAIQSALGQLPIIAEDLGVMTPDVLALRDRFDLPGMRILQFAFGGDAAGSYLPHNFVPNTVVYTGTHDNDTSCGWWQSATAYERAFAMAYLGTDGQEIHWTLIRAASASCADLAITPMQDVLGLSGEHRMNYPGQASGYWEWRFGWDQLEPWHASRLALLTAVHGRCAFELAGLPGPT